MKLISKLVCIFIFVAASATDAMSKFAVPVKSSHELNFSGGTLSQAYEVNNGEYFIPLKFNPSNSFCFPVQFNIGGRTTTANLPNYEIFEKKEPGSDTMAWAARSATGNNPITKLQVRCWRPNPSQPEFLNRFVVAEMPSYGYVESGGTGERRNLQSLEFEHDGKGNPQPIHITGYVADALMNAAADVCGVVRQKTRSGARVAGFWSEKLGYVTLARGALNNEKPTNIYIMRLSDGSKYFGMSGTLKFRFSKVLCLRDR